MLLGLELEGKGGLAQQVVLRGCPPSGPAPARREFVGLARLGFLDALRIRYIAARRCGLGISLPDCWRGAAEPVSSLRQSFS